MSAIDTLIQEVKTWRAATTAPPKVKDPNAQALHELNVKWGQVKATHDAKIQTQREEYLKERERLLKLIPAKAPRGPQGRPKRADYSDAVKIAAYLAAEDHGRTMARTALGIGGDTKLLDRTLAEGKDLYELQQAAAARRAGQALTDATPAAATTESEEW